MGLYKSGGGGAFDETELWTNPSPNASFASQDVTLSGSLSNYDYLKIYFKPYNTTSEYYAIIPKNLISASTGTSSPRAVIGGYLPSTRTFARWINYASNTKLTFTNAAAISSATVDNNAVIPTKICGLK